MQHLYSPFNYILKQNIRYPFSSCRPAGALRFPAGMTGRTNRYFFLFRSVLQPLRTKKYLIHRDNCKMFAIFVPKLS